MAEIRQENAINILIGTTHDNFIQLAQDDDKRPNYIRVSPESLPALIAALQKIAEGK